MQCVENRMFVFPPKHVPLAEVHHCGWNGPPRSRDCYAGEVVARLAWGDLFRMADNPTGTGWAARWWLIKFAPVLLIQLYFVFLRSGFDAFPGGVAFRVSHPLHLLEAGDCVSHVSSVMDGFLTFLGESEVFIGDTIAASFSDLGHAS